VKELNTDRIIKGILVALIGFVIIMGIREGEDAMIYFITGQLGLTLIQGLGMGFLLIIIGILLAIVGTVSKSPKKMMTYFCLSNLYWK